MEPCFNPALETQAVGRVHRLGQKRSVDIVRLVMEKSVEVRIREMLEKKYGSKIAAADADQKEDKKPAAAAMVGSIQSDKAVVMEEEFDLLFGVDKAAHDVRIPDAAESSEYGKRVFI
jgi:hypothetical protein